jgi:antitoxin (DNA-binding transcriptional repressor) of toxin-antitoxin stability system
MKRITADFFVTNCLAVIKEVQIKRESVEITQHGKPVAKLVPFSTAPPDIFNFLAGKGKITGDVVSPVLSAKGK